MIIEKSGTRRHPSRYYRCGIRRRRGDAVCDNGLGVPMERLDGVVAGLVEDKSLTPSRLLRIMDRALEMVRGSREDQHTSDLEDRLASIERKIANLVTATAEGAGHLPSLVRRLKQLEAQKADVEREIERASGMLRPEDVTRDHVEKTPRAVLADFGTGALRRKREMLRHCLRSMKLRADEMLEAATNPLGAMELVGVVCIGGAGSGI